MKSNASNTQEKKRADSPRPDTPVGHFRAVVPEIITPNSINKPNCAASQAEAASSENRWERVRSAQSAPNLTALADSRNAVAHRFLKSPNPNEVTPTRFYTFEQVQAHRAKYNRSTPSTTSTPSTIDEMDGSENSEFRIRVV